MSTNTNTQHTKLKTMRAHKSTGGLTATLFTVVLMVLCVCATTASADYGQAAEHFGVSGEAKQLNQALAIAVNTTGAGGVEPGSIYVVGYHQRSVVRYGPGREGEEPPFREAWGWGVGDGKEEYERCGPALTTEPSQHTYHTCGLGARHGGEFEQTGDFYEPTGIAVDTVTGDVYVQNTASEERRRRHLIEVFTATGTPVGEGFGELGRQSPSPSESISEGPEKLHNAVVRTIAVSESGVVYVTDEDFNTIANPPGEARVMSFAPEQPGDYEHYVYTGQSNDITAVGVNFEFLALIGSERLVASKNQQSIYEYALGAGSTPVCSYRPGGQLWGMTANSVTGEVFYFSEKDGKIHRLGPCDPGTGTFVELQAPMSLTPATAGLSALAVNPGVSWGPLRPEGVLYAADDEEHGTGYVFVPAKVFLPSVVSESVLDTSTGSTVLRAEVNPEGFTTDYSFQYVAGGVFAARKAQAEGEGKSTEEAVEAGFAGATEAPVGGGTLAAGAVGVAEAGLSGLEPETEYRFRVVASSACEGAARPACVTRGGVASFSTYPVVSPGLVDGRAYELVSPPEKNGGEVFPAEPDIGSCGAGCGKPGSEQGVLFPLRSAADGGSVVYRGQPFSAGEGPAGLNEYISKRTSGGWQTSDLSSSLQSPGSSNGSGVVMVDTGLGKQLIYQAYPALTASAPAGYRNLYLRDTSMIGGLEPLMANQPPDRSAASFELGFAGATQDLSRVFFWANDALTRETASAPEPSDPGTFGWDLYEWHEGSLSLVNVAPGNTGVVEGAGFASPSVGVVANPGMGALSPDQHAVSDDGSRVFWSAGGRVYVRVDGQETLEVATGGFLSASANGLDVLLTNGQIYRFNAQTGIYEQALDLTEGQGGFQGILGTGEEEEQFSRVYLVDTQVLVGSGDNATGQAAQSGGDNLYLWEAGAPRYITTLAAKDGARHVDDWAGSPVVRTAEASADGRWLAFQSISSLTGYDNDSKSEETCQYDNGHCAEVFLFNSATSVLSCVSCNPTGEAPRGRSTLRVIFYASGWSSQPRYLTDSGRLVFDSGDRLTVADSNGRVEDVYEYEPDGVGSCGRPAGCVLLISPGTGSVDSNFLAMDETGANIFFTARERLVPQDHDELIDLYDARENGGFSSQTETQRTECQGEACQATLAPPLFTTPGSTTFSGPGNLLQPLPVGQIVKPAKVVAGKKAKTLRACRRVRSKRKRTVCERRARKTARRARNARHAKKGGAR